jgi:hypothetical protein
MRGLDKSGGNVFEITSVPLADLVFCNVLPLLLFRAKESKKRERERSYEKKSLVTRQKGRFTE